MWHVSAMFLTNASHRVSIIFMFLLFFCSLSRLIKVHRYYNNINFTKKADHGCLPFYGKPVGPRFLKMASKKLPETEIENFVSLEQITLIYKDSPGGTPRV